MSFPLSKMLRRRSSKRDVWSLDEKQKKVAALNKDVLGLAASNRNNSTAMIAFCRACETVNEKSELRGLWNGGRKNWLNSTFGLRSLALTAGEEMLAARDYRTASEIADLMQRAETESPKIDRFLAKIALVNEEWEPAKELYSQSKGKSDLSPDKWARQEYLFAEINRLLLTMGVDWIDLSPQWPGSQRQRSIAEFVRGKIASGDFTDPALSTIFSFFAELGQPAPIAPFSAPPAKTVQSIGIESFRNYLAGKTVCLVANSKKLLDSNMGDAIDAYDIVIRFNSFMIKQKDTGKRTDVHVCIHLYEYNLEIPVDIRIMLSGKQELWEESVHTKIRPEAQKWLGDKTLRWPARDLGLIKKTDSGRTPTAGMNILRLLMHLDVNPVIDLIGFDFYDSGMLRLESAMEIEHSRAHNSQAEKEWILSRAKDMSEHVISMRASISDTANV